MVHGGARIMLMSADYHRRRRLRLVAEGKCGHCGKPRGRFAWLCDGCAERHRERQRRKAEKRREQAVL